MINSVFLIFFINLFFFIFFKKISKYYNLYDYPDFKRKIHKKPIALAGGLLFVLNILLVLLIDIFSFKILDQNYFINYFNYLSMFLVLFFFYILGYFDDKYKINANYKLIFMIMFITLSIYLDDSILLKDLRFTFITHHIYLGNFSHFLTVLCFILFINAFNMIDGINAQAISYIIFILIIFILNKILLNFCFLLLIPCIFFLILNIKNKTYLGDSGTLSLGYIFAYIFLKTYNLNLENKFKADEIFLIMSIPGFELLRLAITRLLNSKHPFSPDNLHIHHILIKNIKFLRSYFVIQLMFVFPYMSYLVTKNFYISFSSSLIIYIYLILHFNKNNS